MPGSSFRELANWGSSDVLGCRGGGVDFLQRVVWERESHGAAAVEGRGHNSALRKCKIQTGDRERG